MGNPISRQTAIDEVLLFMVEYCGAAFDEDMQSKMKQRLENLPSAQPAPQWIPCSERPPKESGTYIVTAYDGVSRRVTFVKYQKRLNHWDLSGARSYWHMLAWMPLPESYKGK